MCFFVRRHCRRKIFTFLFSSEPLGKSLGCIAKWYLISQYVTIMLSKAVKQDDRLLVLKTDPYWSIEDMMETNKSILSHPRRCKNVM